MIVFYNKKYIITELVPTETGNVQEYLNTRIFLGILEIILQIKMKF